MNNRLIVIVGPTATGKSKVAVKVAKKINGEIVSADSAQVYIGMDIGTAKISHEEMSGINHYMIDVISPKQNFNIGLYQKKAKDIIERIQSDSHIPILCGGSGLYVNCIINNDYTLPQNSSDAGLRSYYLDLESKMGEGTIYRILSDKYPNRAKKIHPNDYQRILRALECESDVPENSITSWDSSYNLSVYGLNMNRNLLYQKIEDRVDTMFEEGLIDEVNHLLKNGVDISGNAMSALGYKEIIPYIKGECSLEKAKETLKKNTRHFAKRQITWFKRDPRIQWYHIEKEADLDTISEDIIRLEKNSNTW